MVAHISPVLILTVSEHVDSRPNTEPHALPIHRARETHLLNELMNLGESPLSLERKREELLRPYKHSVDSDWFFISTGSKIDKQEF